MISIRMDPAALQRAKVHVKSRRRVLGEWLEEAIREKMDRETNQDG